VRALCLAACVIVAAPPAVAQQQPNIFVRPLASLLLPGSGQLMGHQDRGAVYLAAEVYLLSRFLQLDHEALTEARHYRNLAFDVARHAYTPTVRDTVFEYYEQMERFTESGAYDAGNGTTFVPESDPATYNGSVWLLARRTFWANPDVPPDPTSPQYWRALEFYQTHAITPSFLYSWRNHSLEHEVFKDFIRRSDNAFRSAQNQIGLLLANHVLSAVDALISARMRAAAGRDAAVRTTVVPGYAEVRLSLTF
jgi:hypothetical protein